MSGKKFRCYHLKSSKNLLFSEKPRPTTCVRRHVGCCYCVAHAHERSVPLHSTSTATNPRVITQHAPANMASCCVSKDAFCAMVTETMAELKIPHEPKAEQLQILYCTLVEKKDVLKCSFSVKLCQLLRKKGKSFFSC